MKSYVSNSLRETEVLGKRLGSLLERGDMVCMSGDLGAGKTFFTKAMAVGMGIEEDVTSPTYTIINEYDGMVKLYHLDVYRIMEIEEMYDIGYEEYFFGDGVCIVEWADMVRELLPDDYLWIEIERTGEKTRRFTFSASGNRYEKLLKELF